MLSDVKLTTTESWQKLGKHYQDMSRVRLLDLFKNDPQRLATFSTTFETFYIDFSKHYVTTETLALFEQLAKECQLEAAKEAMLNGEPINRTENRSVLHIALRTLSDRTYSVKGENVMPMVREVRNKMRAFVSDLHSGKWTGFTGRKINSIVNIGIGGSDLGPYMVSKALKPYQVEGIKSYFVSNVDASDLLENLEELDPETTLFIIASKTFTTQETMTNANTARDWFLRSARDSQHIAKHFVAVSTNAEKVSEFGIDTSNMFEFWDWVGGRYSLWSAIGLSIACTVGYDNFEELLGGAEAMDDHFFRTKGVANNIPTMMAMIGIWYNNFFGAETHAILPYDHLLSHFSRYLQQGDMESNGKSIDRTGEKLDYQSGQIIWGEPGTNGQHAFYQLIHQGTKLIPADFIASIRAPHEQGDHQDKLIANFIAQTEALMIGKTAAQVREELTAAGKTAAEIEKLIPYKVFEGGKPTTSILMDQLTPRALGSLISLYEHKIFVQGIIWNVYSYDQWGVELGKQLAGKILNDFTGTATNHDPSTTLLIERYRQLRKT